jgi:hypothetical protein
MADQDREVTIVIKAKNLSEQELAKLRRQLAGVSASAKDETGKIRPLFQSLNREIGSTTGSSALLARGLGALSGVVTIGALTGLVRSFVGFGSEIKNMAAQASIGTTEFQVLKLSGRDVGVEITKTTNAIVAFSDRLGRRDAGAVGALHALGFSLDDLLSQDPAARFLSVAKAIGDITDPATRTTFAIQLFGREGPKILEVARNYDAAKAAAERTNSVLSKDQVEALDRAGNAWDRLTERMKVWGAQAFVFGIDMPGRIKETATDAAEGLNVFGRAIDAVRHLSIAQILNFRQATVATTELTGATKQQTQATTQALTPADLLRNRLKGFRDELGQLRTQAVTPLTRDQKELVRSAAALGKSVQEIAEKTGLAEPAIRALVEADRQAEKATDGHRAAIRKLVEEFSGAGAIQAAREMHEALAELPPIHELSREAQERVLEVIEKGIRAYERLGLIAPEALRRTWEAHARLAGVVSLGGMAGLAPVSGSSISDFDRRGALPSRPIGTGAGTFGGIESGIVGLPGGTATNLFSRLFGGNFAGGLTQTVLGAFMGGGNVGQSVGGFVGSSLLSGTIGKTIGAGLTKALGSTIGGALGSVVPGLGTLVGGFLGGGIGKLFGGLFGMSEGKRRNLEADKELDALRQNLVSGLGGAGQVAGLERLFGTDIMGTFAKSGKGGPGGGGVAGLEIAKQDVEAFTKKVDALKASIPEVSSLLQQATQFGGQLPGPIAAAVGHLRELGLLQGEQEFNWREMQERAEKYGISLSGLGPKFQGARLREDAKDILDTFEMMTQNGANAGTVLAGMSDEISQLVQDSKKFGVDVPENMRPLIERLMETGRLVDEDGKKITSLSGIKFGDPIVAGMDAIVQRLDRLLTGLGIQLPDAMAQGVEGAAREAGRLPRLIDDTIRRIPRKVPITVEYRNGGVTGGEFDAGDVRGSAAGGLFAKPTFRVIAEREPEIVGSPNVIVEALAAALRRTMPSPVSESGSSANAQPYVVPMMLDAGTGRTRPLTADEVRRIQDALNSGLLRLPARMLVNRTR